MLNQTPKQLKSIIVDLLSKQPMALGDLQTAASVSLPTLRRDLQELIDSGWVRSVGQNTATGGRPARIFGLSDSTHLIVGVDIQIPTVNYVLTTLDGTLIEQTHIARSENLTPNEAVEQIIQYVRNVQSNYPDRNVLGMGLAAPGYVNAAGEILFVGRAPHWQNYPLKTRLESTLNLPVVIENATDCMIRAEIDHNNNLTASNLVYLAIMEGLKVSMLLNGELYKGAFGNAGLIGRVRLASHLDMPDAGRPFDLEMTASIGGMGKTFDRMAAEGQTDATSQQIQAITDHHEKFAAIIDAAGAQHPLCTQVIEQMIDDLSLAVANLIFILQPHVLIIGGQLNNIPDWLTQRLETDIRDKLPPLLSNHLQIVFAATKGRHAAAIGATHWFLRHYIKLETAFQEKPVSPSSSLPAARSQDEV